MGEKTIDRKNETKNTGANLMGFGGGGGGQLTPHVHNSVPLQGGPLDFTNNTIASLTAGSTTFSDGAALQELVIGNAAEVLTVNGAGTAPEWAVTSGGAGELCYGVINLDEDGLRNDLPLYGVQIDDGSSPVFGKTLTDVSFWLRKVGNPTGDGEVRIYNSSGALQATSDSPTTWAALTGGWVKYTFTFAAPHTIAVGDRIVIGGGTTGIGQEVSFYGDQSSSETTFQSLVYYTTSTATWAQWNGGTSGARWCWTA